MRAYQLGCGDKVATCSLCGKLFKRNSRVTQDKEMGITAHPGCYKNVDLLQRFAKNNNESWFSKNIPTLKIEFFKTFSDTELDEFVKFLCKSKWFDRTWAFHFNGERYLTKTSEKKTGRKS